MTPAIVALQSLGIEFEIHQFENKVTNDYARHAAQMLGITEDTVFKTLICQAPDANLLVAIVPASRQLNMKHLARAAQYKRVALAAQQIAEAKTGYLKGAISPFGQRTQLPTYLDHRASMLPSIYVSGGRRGLEIEIESSALLSATGGKLAEISQ